MPLRQPYAAMPSSNRHRDKPEDPFFDTKKTLPSNSCLAEAKENLQRRLAVLSSHPQFRVQNKEDCRVRNEENGCAGKVENAESASWNCTGNKRLSRCTCSSSGEQCYRYANAPCAWVAPMNNVENDSEMSLPFSENAMARLPSDPSRQLHCISKTSSNARDDFLGDRRQRCGWFFRREPPCAVNDVDVSSDIKLRQEASCHDGDSTRRYACSPSTITNQFSYSSPLSSAHTDSQDSKMRGWSRNSPVPWQSLDSTSRDSLERLVRSATKGLLPSPNARRTRHVSYSDAVAHFLASSNRLSPHFSRSKDLFRVEKLSATTTAALTFSSPHSSPVVNASTHQVKMRMRRTASLSTVNESRLQSQESDSDIAAAAVEYNHCGESHEIVSSTEPSSATATKPYYRSEATYATPTSRQVTLPVLTNGLDLPLYDKEHSALDSTVVEVLGESGIGEPLEQSIGLIDLKRVSVDVDISLRHSDIDHLLPFERKKVRYTPRKRLQVQYKFLREGMFSSVMSFLEPALAVADRIYETIQEGRVLLGFPPPRDAVLSRSIVYEASGTFLPGKLVAILGPSGAGKSTLLNVLAGRIAQSQGEIHFKQELMLSQADLRQHCAYIQQRDLFLRSITPEEHLEIQADLRLARASPLVRKAAARQLIRRFGLQACRNTFIGAGPEHCSTDGISGGERKRLAVATELLTDPPVLIADEPTTGLDASSAKSVVLALRHVADRGCCVIASLHQPSTAVFELFDEVLLMAEGRILFFGERLAAIEWFERLGYVCPKYANPADFMVRIISHNKEQGTPCASSSEATSATVASPRDGIDSNCVDDPRLKHLERIYGMANKWAAEGDSFFEYWASRGQFDFFAASRDYAAGPIAAAIFSETLPLELASQVENSSATGVNSINVLKRNRAAGIQRHPHYRSNRRPQLNTTKVTRRSSFSNSSLRSERKPRKGLLIGLRYAPRLKKVVSKTKFSLERLRCQLAPIPPRKVAIREGLLAGMAGTEQKYNSALMSSDTGNIGSEAFNCTGMSQMSSITNYFNSSGTMLGRKINVNIGKPSWSRRFQVVLKRDVVATLRDRLLTHTRLIQAVVVSTILSSIFFQLGDTLDDSKSKLSGIFFILTNQGLVAALSVCSTFTAEKAVIQREIDGGVFNSVEYVLAKITSDLPIQTILPLIFNTICFWAMRLRYDFHRYLLSLIVAIAVSYAAISVGYLGSAIAHSGDEALMLAQIWAIPALLFGGFVLKLNEIPWAFSWFQYFSYFRYGYVAYAYLTFHDVTLNFIDKFGVERQYPGDQRVYCPFINQWSLLDIAFAMQYVRGYLGFSVDSTRGFWKEVLLLFLMVLLFRLMIVAVMVPASRRWKNDEKG